MERSNDSLSGRTRNIAQDMEALRVSRQDNPYLQQVMASRESLLESHISECESDDTILMSQDFGSSALNLAEEDPFTLKEVHDHMIRSPPPTSCWPHDSNRASSAFIFGGDSPVSYSACSVAHDKESRRARSIPRPRHSRSASPHSHDAQLSARPLSLPGESHLRNALSKKQSSGDRFSLLQHPKPLRKSSGRRDEDSIHLVQE